jgi:1-pyrroline-5-carboxylate dehydrogenase
MNNTIFRFDVPQNEPQYTYAPNSPEREGIRKELERLKQEVTEIPVIINGREVRTGRIEKIPMPHDHRHALASYHVAGEKEASAAIAAAQAAKQDWMNLSWVERASITLKAAALIARKYRFTLNAATMLGQSKSVHQAEIDASCETIDFLRYNAYFASEIYANQPRSGFSQLNRMEYRPLEGFVYVVTPFNFTAIGSNLNMSVILMGNTTIWKPATTSLFSNYVLMKIFQEAGVPDGVINFLPGYGPEISKVVVPDKNLAGIHLTGSNATFNTLWKQVGTSLENYRSYPRLVGETGGKDFLFAHASANPHPLATALVRGAFEYQGQKCSAASRAYIPRSLWKEVRKLLEEMVAEIKVGDVSDLKNFMNAVIDKNAYTRIMGYINEAKANPDCEILCGGKGSDETGYFIQPTIIVTRDPKSRTMTEEIFGPVLTVFVYEDDQFEETLHLCDETSPYALTGAVFTNDRYVFVRACQILRYSAGNFYLNDKPTGAMVGLQPFGGARGSGTNDKAGGPLNLLRWISPRTIKETFVPPHNFPYPYMS